MKSKKIIVGIGELLWDSLPTGKRLGGAPCNFAFHASLFGCESYIVSAVGNDNQGKELIEVVSNLHIESKYIQKNSYQTGNVSVKLNKEGHPDYIIHDHVGWDYVEWNDALIDLAKKTDAVCFGTLAQRNNQTQTTIINFLEAVSGKCLKVFDINLRQHYYSAGIIHDSLVRADILKLNEDELPVLASFYNISGNYEEQLQILMEKFELKYIAYTMGGKGSFLMNKHEMSYMKAPEVIVVDTVGAGDSFTAILTVGVLNNLPLKEIHERATEVSAYVCTCEGATPDIDKSLLQF